MDNMIATMWSQNLDLFQAQPDKQDELPFVPAFPYPAGKCHTCEKHVNEENKIEESSKVQKEADKSEEIQCEEAEAAQRTIERPKNVQTESTESRRELRKPTSPEIEGREPSVPRVSNTSQKSENAQSEGKDSDETTEVASRHSPKNIITN